MVNLPITDTDIDELVNKYDSKLTFCQKRREVIQNCNDIQACPGSGKTTLVAAKLIILSKKWIEKHKGICVLTHTNTAKSVILKMLQKHPSGFKLLSYPHFIGTIQEFVDRFLGIPYCKSAGWEVKVLDSEGYAKELFKLNWMKFTTKTSSKKYPFLYYIRSKKINFDDFTYYFDCGILKLNEKFLKSVDKHIVTNGPNIPSNYFQYKKQEICKRGIFPYKDMYAFARKLLFENLIIKRSLQDRFPVVFIDEMQDTQEYQDDLLNQIFKCDKVVMQRLGDPDQAIFDGISGEKPNKTYNNARLVPIIDSHRFGNDIASKIKGLSYNRLSNLRSIRSPSEGQYPHTIFLYDDKSIQNVLDAFGSLIDNLQLEHKDQLKVIKAVGGVGKEKPDGLTIKHYWDQYDNSKASKSFKAKRLINIVKKCSEQREGNVSENYELLLQGIVDLLRTADKKTRNTEEKEVYYSKTSFIKELKENNKFNNFRQILTTWIINEFPTQNIWCHQIEQLRLLLGLDEQNGSNTKDFISYDNALTTLPDQKISATNIYECDNGLKIEVSTIHGVKAETHDATLILETKYRKNDISSMLDFFTADTPKHPGEDTLQAGYMRKLYVATSRPRHLLCLAINRENVSQKQVEKLYAKGWSIICLMSAHEPVR